MEPVPCADALRQSDPVFVPSFVEFTVRTIALRQRQRARHPARPDTGEWLPPQDFTVGIGKRIGGMRTKLKLPRRADPGAAGQDQG